MTGKRTTFTRPISVHAIPATVVVAIALLALLTACGGAATGSGAKVYDVKASLASLHGAGWTATEAPGMPDTLTKVRQVGYLEAAAPDGQMIDLQFLEDSDKADAELAAAQQEFPSFNGKTFGNVLVFAHPTGNAEVPEADLKALYQLLK